MAVNLKIRYLMRVLAGCVALSVSACLQAGEPRDVAFVAACDGTEQRYVLIEPEGVDPKSPRDLLIALHGHGSDRWQFVNGTGGELFAPKSIAARHGMLFVSPDYRARTSWMGPKAEADLVQIIAELKQTYSIQKVFLCGGSMGGSSALTFAALHPELIDGVASNNGTANHLEYEKFQEAISESYGGSKKSIPEEYKKRSAEYWPERLTMPVGIAAGGRDAVVPPQSVVRLAAVLKQLDRPVQIIYREEGGHSTTYDDSAQLLEYVITEARKPVPGNENP